MRAKSRTAPPNAEKAPLSRFISAMKLASGTPARRQKNRSREIPGADVRTPHMILARAFTRENLRLALPTPKPARCGSVMRYRSATVAGFHGLPC